MKNIIDLSGKKILVTGASSGIGRETAILLGQVGADVILLGRNESALQETREQMIQSGGNCLSIIKYDLSQPDGIAGVIEEAVGSDGRKLDGLAHCAGITAVVPIKNLDCNLLDHIMRTNFYSFVELVKHYSLRKNNNGGSIVGISSVAAVRAGSGMVAYGASKAAMNAAVISLSKELAKKNIRVNSIMPGMINTRMIQREKETWQDAFKNNQIMGLGEPIDIANMIAFLLSDAARFITGTNIEMDGGRK